MNPRNPTLADIASGELPAGLQLGVRQLRAALEASGARAAPDLQSFYEAVCRWRRAANTEETGALSRWIDEVAKPFVAELDSAGWAWLAEQSPTAAAAVDFLWAMLHCAPWRALGAAAEGTATRLLADVPPVPPDDSNALWASVARRLLSVVGNVAPALLTKTLAGMRPWLLSAVLAQVDQIPCYHNVAEPLADGLLRLPVENAAQAFAEVLTSSPSTAVLALLQDVVRPPLPDATRDTSPGRPSAVRLCEAIKTRNASPEVANLLDAWLAEPEELANLVGSYLRAEPANHEDAFDLLTAHSSEKRGDPIPRWGERGFVKSWMAVSMRIRHGADQRGGIFAPDFETATVLAGVPPDALVRFIREQPNARFLVEYLARLPSFQYPHVDAVCERVAGDSTIEARLSAARGREAGYVLTQLDWLAYAHPSIAELRDRLAPLLIPRIPTADLLHGPGEFFQNPALAPHTTREVEARGGAAANLAELVVVLRTKERWRLGLGEQDFAHAAEMGLPPGGAGAELLEWMGHVQSLFELHAETAVGLLARLTAEQIECIYREHPGLGAPAQYGWDAHRRLALGAHLLEVWLRLDRAAAVSVLGEPEIGQRDFLLLLQVAGLCRNGDWNPPAKAPAKEPEPPTGFREAEHWLDILEQADSALAEQMLVALLHHAQACLSRRTDRLDTLDGVAAFLRWAVAKTGDSLHPGYLDVLARRIEQLPPDGAAEAVAIAAVSLPVHPEAREKYLERVLPEVDRRLAGAELDADGTLLLRALRAVLQAEFPRLTSLLTARPVPRTPPAKRPGSSRRR